MPEKRLGRGLDFLINSEEARFEGDEILELEVESIHPNRLQPRQHFDPEHLQTLADSIRLNGVLQPIVVRPASGGYEIIAGERRWRASKQAGRDTIPAVVRDATEEQLLALALVENLHRSDLNPIEKAEACQNLMTRFRMTQEEAARRIGKSRSSLANLLRLLDLPEAVRNLVSAGALSTGHAKVLSGVAEPETAKRLAQEVVDRGLSVRQLEGMVRPAKERPEKSPDPKPSYIVDLEERLHTALGTKVTIRARDDRGKIVIDFYSQDDFERLLEALEKAARS